MSVGSVWQTGRLLVEIGLTIVGVFGIGLPLAIAIILVCG